MLYGLLSSSPLGFTLIVTLGVYAHRVLALIRRVQEDRVGPAIGVERVSLVQLVDHSARNILPLNWVGPGPQPTMFSPSKDGPC